MNEKPSNLTFNEQRNAQFKVDLIRELGKEDIIQAYVDIDGFNANINGVSFWGKTTNEIITKIKTSLCPSLQKN